MADLSDGTGAVIVAFPSCGGAAAELALADQPLDRCHGQRHQHHQHRAIGERDAVVAVADSADDVGRRQFILRGHEEDHGRDGRHRAHETVDQRRDDGRLEQRQDDAPQGRRGACMQHRRGLVERTVDLLERGGAGAYADRQAAEDEAQDDDERGARQLERWHVEDEHVADAEHRAGNGEGEQRAELEDPLAAEFRARQQPGDEQAERRAQRRRDRREPERREERVPRRAGPDNTAADVGVAPLQVERGDEVAQRRRVVAAPGGDEAADEGEEVDDDRERQPRPDDSEHGPRQARRQPHRQAGVALARDRRIGDIADDFVLQREDSQREGREQERERGGTTMVELGADDGEEDIGREHVVLAADDDRIAEVGEAFDEADEKRVGQAGLEQRQRDGAKRCPAIGTKRLRRLLERRADAGDDAAHDEAGDRREGEELLTAVSPSDTRPTR